MRDTDVIGSLMWPSRGLDINRIDSFTTVLGFRGGASVVRLPKHDRLVGIDCEPTTRGVGTTYRVRDALMYPG